MTARSDEPRERQGDATDVPKDGDIIAGRYRVERVLGQGGMGVVVAARHTSLRQRVAVKFLRPAAMRLQNAPQRFLREAQASAAIHSEHVARVTDMGTLPTGSPFMVMEYLDGTDLSSVLKTRGHLPMHEAVDYVLQACEALAEAHKLGIVHRDLKPSNVFLTARADGSPLVKVLDFGLSKVLDPEAVGAAESSLTETEMVVGSPHYMSPEHVRSLKHVDARTDIWSLGVILYQLLAGRRPFDGDSLPSVFAQIVADPPHPLRRARPEVPAGLEAAVLRCLEKDVTRRFQSVAELARELAPFAPEASRISIERISRVLPDDKTGKTRTAVVLEADDSTTASASTWVRTKARTRRRATLALAGGGAAMAAALVTMGLVLALRDRGGAAPEGAGAPVHGEVVSVTAALPAPTAAPHDARPSGVSTAAATAGAAGTSEPATLDIDLDEEEPGAAGRPAGSAAPSAASTTQRTSGPPPSPPSPPAQPAAVRTAAPSAAPPSLSVTAPPKREGSALDRWD